MRAGGAVSFVHTSDWQLGMTRHWLRGEAQARYTAARIDAVRAIGAVARQEGCDFVVVAGDVFESSLLAPRTVQRSLEAMGSVGLPVYLLPGNHDPLDAVSIYRSAGFLAACPDNVVVLDRSQPVPVADGVEIVAAPWTSKEPLEDLLGAALRATGPATGLRIAVGHGALDVLNPDGGDAASIAHAEIDRAVSDGRIHYAALGDRHSRLAVGRSGRIHYSGSPEVTDFRDERPGDVLVVRLDPRGGVDVVPRRVGTWRFVSLRRHVGGPADLDLLDAELGALDPKDRTVVRTALVGTLRLADRARLDALLARHEQSLAARLTWAEHDDLAVVVGDGELEDLGIGGFVDDAVAELAGRAAAAGPEGDDARSALALLYRLAQGAGP